MGGIPSFPDFGEVTLDLRGELAPVLRSLGAGVAEFTFPNLYLFRNAHGYRVSRLGPFVLVTGQGYGGEPYAFPPLGPAPGAEEAARALCEHLAAQGEPPALFPVPERWVRERFREGWIARAERDQADYVYLREELALLEGRRFQKRRNRLAKLLREIGGAYQYRELEEGDVAACRELARGWCSIRCSVQRPATFLETEAAVEALARRDALGLRGAVIRVGGRVAAFCLGEELDSETFVVHFEKADPGRDGLAQLINRDFCLHGLEGYRYVNREQDLGDPGLRRAKESYHPAFLAAKFRVVPR